MDIRATVNYHLRKSTSQAFVFDEGGVEGNLISPELVAHEVSVIDKRESLNQLSFKSDGIRFDEYPTEVKSFKNDEDWKEVYERELSTYLTDTLNAKSVWVFDHTVRLDTETAIRKPARNVHNDYSEKAAKQRLIDLLGEAKAAELNKSHFGFVNVWRPIDRPITSSPLGFIEPMTMNQKDWMTIDLIYPNRRGEILGVDHNPNHQWFYVSNMTPKEIAVFNIFDNKGKPFFAHSALDLLENTVDLKPRQSIETRTLIEYQ